MIRYYLNHSNPTDHSPMKNFQLYLSPKARIKTHSNPNIIHPFRNKMNKNLMASFITPTITQLPLIIFTVLVPSIVFPKPNLWIHNHRISTQQWWVQLTWKQIIAIHNHRGQTWTWILHSIYQVNESIRTFLPSFTLTTQLSTRLGPAIPLWARTVMPGFPHKNILGPFSTTRNPHSS